MNDLKTNKTRKIFTIFAVAIGLFIAINVVMWCSSFASTDSNEEWPVIAPYNGATNYTKSWKLSNDYNNTIDKDHLVTDTNCCKYQTEIRDNGGIYSTFTIQGVYMTVDRSYLTVHYSSKSAERMPIIFWRNTGGKLFFNMDFYVYDNEGNTIMTLNETTETREDTKDGGDKLVFHANGGKGGSDFITPTKPVTVICNELVNRGLITKEFADNTSLEELIKYGYVKVTFTEINMENLA